MKNNICLGYIPAPDSDKKCLQEIDFKKLTHICIAFALINTESGVSIPYLNEKSSLGAKNIIEEIRLQNPFAKIILSIGGAGNDGFCDAAKTKNSRAAFARETLRLMEEYGFDGVDIDWEFPGEETLGIKKCKSCKNDFLLLLQEIRSAIGSRLLTIAVGSNRYTGLDVKEINNTVDYILVMTYDLGITHSSSFLTKAFVNMWRLHGAEKNKICLGVPFYGRNVRDLEKSADYKELKNSEKFKIFGQSFSRYKGNVWCFDTRNDIFKKGKWTVSHGFAGIFCWQLKGDKDRELLNAMYNSVNR